MPDLSKVSNEDLFAELCKRDAITSLTVEETEEPLKPTLEVAAIFTEWLLASGAECPCDCGSTHFYAILPAKVFPDEETFVH